MKVSIIMANFNGATFLDASIASVLRQSHTDLEVIVADDASTDGSQEKLRLWVQQDPRVKFIELKENGGAARARNHCLREASGDWIAIVDSDDILHPERIGRMLTAACDMELDFVADDILFISQSASAAGRSLLQSLSLTEARAMTARDLIASDTPDGELPPLGYLKLLIRRDVVGETFYDETLSISEDFDFYLHILVSGANGKILPDPMYGYRRHTASLSYRLSVAAVERMIAAQRALSDGVPAELKDALRSRMNGLQAALAYERLVAALKEQAFGTATVALLQRPTLMRKLVRSFLEGRRAAVVRAPERTSLRVSLGTQDDRCDVSISVPDIPPPGQAWAEPVAPIAAQLSALSASHRLDIAARGTNGLWMLWLVPEWERATLELDKPYAGPVPEGVIMASSTAKGTTTHSPGGELATLA